MNPRTTAAVAVGRVAGAASRALGRGGGTAVAGLVAQRIDPALVERLAAQLGQGAVVVSGTNGKTTTSRMLAAIAGEAGLRPLANPSGSNLMRGVATALLDETALLGRVHDASQRLGVFEVDEATVPEAARALRPRAIVLTNLFRDQLDRYGEVDTVAALWRRALETLPDGAALVLSADDPAVASLRTDAKGPVLTYGIEDIRVAEERLEHASDYRFCLSCGEELSYAAAFYGHLGHWRCPACGNARPRPDVRATCVEPSSSAMRLVVATPQGELRVELPLAGLYNVENALAATAGALALGLPLDAVERALGSFRAAFGRQERFEVDGRHVEVLLAKNPTGLNQVLRTIASNGPAALHLLLFLNDDIQDGRDISWIWDADYERLAGRVASAIVSGARAEELALRLKYAGFAIEPPIVHDARAALDGALAQTPPGETLYVVPTYTAMLIVRELLAKRGQRRPYWKEA
ncbi:MAG: MurT ligase domain-containing protein [Dehalococcoidia bacterium]